MQIGRIDGCTRICGEAQGYEPLPLRDEIVDVLIGSEIGKANAMVTAWVPSPAELKALNEGASIYVRILGDVPPPMNVEVGPLPLSDPYIP